MERLAAAALGARQRPRHWLVTAEALATLRDLAERDAHLDAPILRELDPPMFMGIPVKLGVPASGELPVELILEAPDSAATS